MRACQGIADGTTLFSVLTAGYAVLTFRCKFELDGAFETGNVFEADDAFKLNDAKGGRKL